jgi:hypothetical protein
MSDLSPAAQSALDALIDANCGDEPMPSEIRGLTAVLCALADHQPQRRTLDGPQDHWDPDERTRSELQNIADELLQVA